MKIIKQIFELFKVNNYNEILKIFENAYGIDCNIKDINNMYMIHYAIINNQEKLIKLLIHNNAKLDILDNEGFSLLYVPIKFNFKNVINLLLYIKSVGIPITEVKDNDGRIALNYAIQFNNIDIFKIILKHTININNTDFLNRNNILIYAVNYSTYNVVSELLNREDLNINAKNKYGTTALHFACNNNNLEVMKLLLQSKNIDVNCVTYNNSTPLMSCYKTQNTDIIYNLIDAKSDIHIQDVSGNTALHIFIIEKNITFSNILIPNITKYNLLNDKSETVLHTILTLYDDDSHKYNLITLLEGTNLNIQNIKGDTVLHMIVKLNIWMDYIKILINKKNNIFIKNKKNITVYDIIKNTPNCNKFIKVIIYSYLNILLKKKYKFNTKWENNCNDNIKKCKKYITYNIIKNHISVPTKKHKYTIMYDENHHNDVVLFFGIVLNAIIGLLLLYEINSNIITTLNNNNLLFNTSFDEYLSSFTGTRSKIDFENIYIYWFHQEIFYPDNFNIIIDNYINSNKIFLFVPIQIDIIEGAHANIIIIDKNQKCIERFEPNGSKMSGNYNYNGKLLDSLLSTYFKNYFIDYDYYDPSRYIPAIGFQYYDDDHAIYFSDPVGFCLSWCFWYAKQRLINHTIPLEKFIHKLINYIRFNNLSFRKIIRQYSQTIVLKQQDFLKSVSNEVNLYLNNEHTLVDITKIQSLIHKIISDIT